MARRAAWLTTAVIAGLGAAAIAGHGASHSDPPAAELTGLQASPNRAIMPGYGREQVLGPSEIADLTEYVLALSGRATDMPGVERAIPAFQRHCAACHGLAGKGDPDRGVPDLSDEAWIHGGERDAIREQIWNGDDGRGPRRHAVL